MAYADEWQTVAKFLQRSGAQHYRNIRGAAVYYVPRTGQFVKVVRNQGGGYVYTVHRNAADCGCGG